TNFRKDYRLLRQGGRLVMYGASELSGDGRRSFTKLARGLTSMPLATTPWWKSLGALSENKMVGGLNMLSWWDREQNLDRVLEPLGAMLEAGAFEPVVAEGFPFERAGDAHRLIADPADGGKVVLVPYLRPRMGARRGRSRRLAAGVRS